MHTAAGCVPPRIRFRIRLAATRPLTRRLIVRNEAAADDKAAPQNESPNKRRSWRDLLASGWKGLLAAATTLALFLGLYTALHGVLGSEGQDPIAAPHSGPARVTYSCRKPAPCVGFDGVVLNALPNNPGWGDERNFLLVKQGVAKNSSGWRDTVRAMPGQTLLIKMIVSNGSHSRNAENTRASLEVPPESDTHLFVTARLSATNAQPPSVYDQVRIDAARPIALEYVGRSTRVYGNGFNVRGKPLSDFFATDGALLGHENFDGQVRPAFGGILFVYARLRVLPGHV